MSWLHTKNPSPRQLSAVTAILIALANAGLSLLLQPPWYVPLIVLTVTFSLAYGLYFYAMQQFIYRKIKLIYKFIYQTKATHKEEFFFSNVLPQKSIEEVSRDVEEWASRRKMEIEHLQATEQFRKEFLMNLAHELRTPIFTVQGYVDTLIDGAIDDPAVNRKFLANASRGIDRLVRLVDDLNAISRLESGRVPLSWEVFTIQDLVQEVFDELSMRAGDKSIDMSLKRGTEGAISVRADRGRIRQVLVNLVENAIKYGNNHGSITVGCYKMDEKRVYVEVSDDGPGISEDHLPRIFERFYRAERSRSRDVGGTGLGLAIVKHIVEAHGQAITARSKLSVGSSFGFTLDRKE